MKIGSTFPFSL